MRSTLTGLVLGVTAFVAACELVLRVLPVSTATMVGRYIDPHIQTYPADHTWTVSTGWDLRNPQRLTSNNLGFASERPFAADPRAVALVGDSYVESSMLAAHHRPGAQLERLLGGTRPVYAMGGPGSSLLDYAERVRYAYQKLEVRDFVILVEAGDVRQSMCGSGNVHAVCLAPGSFALRIQTHPTPSMLKTVMRHSALAQYVAGQIRADPGLVWRNMFTRDVPAHPAPSRSDSNTPSPVTDALPDERARMVDAVTETFFARLQESAPKARLLVLADGARSPSQPLEVGLGNERRRFLHGVRQRGVTVLDGEGVFAQHAAASALSLSVGPYDAHLNAKGVELLMSLAADALR